MRPAGRSVGRSGGRSVGRAVGRSVGQAVGRSGPKSVKQLPPQPQIPRSLSPNSSACQTHGFGNLDYQQVFLRS